jgi:ABC-type transport system substrate-binding protein
MEGVIGYDANAANSKEYAKYDPEMAKKLLADSNYNGEEIYFMAIDGKVPRTKEVLQAIQAMMTEVGFNVKLEIMEGATFVAKRSAGEYDLGFSNIFYGNGSSLNHANMHYVSDSAHTEFVNEKQLSLINEASMTVDLEKQNELMRQAFQIAMEEGAPMQYILSLDMFAIYTSNIENIVVFPDGVMDLRNITVK